MREREYAPSRLGAGLAASLLLIAGLAASFRAGAQSQTPSSAKTLLLGVAVSGVGVENRGPGWRACRRWSAAAANRLSAVGSGDEGARRLSRRRGGGL